MVVQGIEDILNILERGVAFKDGRERGKGDLTFSSEVEWGEGG